MTKQTSDRRDRQYSLTVCLSNMATTGAHLDFQAVQNDEIARCLKANKITFPEFMDLDAHPGDFANSNLWHPFLRRFRNSYKGTMGAWESER
jgi:hypothetical protein